MPNITICFLQYSLVGWRWELVLDKVFGWIHPGLTFACSFVCFHFWLVISYSTLCPSQQDNNSNRIVSGPISRHNVDIAAFSPVKPEAQVGMYTLRAFIGDPNVLAGFWGEKYGKSHMMCDR